MGYKFCARSNELPDKLYWIFPPLYKLLNQNFPSVIHGKNKMEAPTPQSTNLYIKIEHNQISLFSLARVSCMDKMTQKKENHDYNLSLLTPRMLYQFSPHLKALKILQKKYTQLIWGKQARLLFFWPHVIFSYKLSQKKM